MIGVGPAPTAAAPSRGRRRGRLRRLVPIALGMMALGSLLLAVDPGAVVAAARRFDGRLLAPLLALALAFYLLQGLRWHQLLRAVGIRQKVVDSELMNLSGQAVTAVVPLGDLTRALLASEASGADFGAAAATVTVQELTFTLLLVLVATPSLVRLPGGQVLMGLVVVGVGAVVAILTIPAVYGVVRRLVGRLPGLRRLLPQIDALQREVLHLLGRADVLAYAVLDLGRVVVAVTSFWLVLVGLGAGVSWGDATLVLAVSYIGGALSLLPGGVGANEATVVGVLALLGVGAGDAAAAALLQRLTLAGFATIGGLAAWTVLRRRVHLGRLADILAGRPGPTAGVEVPGHPHPGDGATPDRDGEEAARSLPCAC